MRRLLDRHLSFFALISCLFLLATLCTAAQAEGVPGDRIAFERTQLDDKFRSEGVSVGDFNRDGKRDIAAGAVWYAAPDWSMQLFGEKAEVYPVKGYAPSFANFAADLNGDGWIDQIVVDFPSKPTWWLENPQGKPGPWKRHLCIPVTNNESPAMRDLDGDGRRELLAAYSPDPQDFDGPKRRMGFMTRRDDPTAAWVIHPVSEPAAPGTRRYDHGLGAGDVNGDGRIDILTTAGWWECPADRTAGPWEFHAAPLGEAASNMWVFDYDGDGDNDVLSSSAHRFGIWWHEQLPDGAWKTHTIDKSYSQMHAVEQVDLNGDGLPDFVTGKRWYAHGGGDPGADGAAVVYWYELTRVDGRPVWKPHQIDDDSGVGTQFEVTDVDGDGLLDVVTANKKGVHYFRQVRK